MLIDFKCLIDRTLQGSMVVITEARFSVYRKQEYEY